VDIYRKMSLRGKDKQKRDYKAQRATTVFAKQGLDWGNPITKSLIGCIRLDDIVLKEMKVIKAIKVLKGITTEQM
jgi:hypothetical protein